MAEASAEAVTLSDDERVARIRADVASADRELRARHPWLNHQNLIGAGIMAFALAGMLACACAYARGAMSAWLVIPLVAIFASLTHELEHDLIHTLYFRQRPWARHVMLALAWIARPSTINPWIRIGLHLRHHKLSGTPEDIEERAITNGVPWGIARFLMLADAPCSVLIRFLRAPKGARLRVLWRSALVYFQRGCRTVRCDDRVAAGDPAGAAVAGFPDRRLDRAERAAQFLPAHGEQQHALLRRRGAREPHAADAGTQALVAVAAAIVLFQLRRHARHSPLLRAPVDREPGLSRHARNGCALQRHRVDSARKQMELLTAPQGCCSRGIL